jgi:hypothetical protein
MIVGIVGVPPWDMMQEYIRGGAEIVDLDEPVAEFPVKDIFLPNSYCSILKRVVSNIFSLREAGRLDLVLATVGECKCDGMRNIARWLEAATDIPVRAVKNMNREGTGWTVCASGLPPARKMELIVNSVYMPLPDGLDLAPCAPRCGFWGVPPSDFSILDIFPDETHIYGWTRCMENKTPADLDLECAVDAGVPTVFFTQAFCQKSALAFNLAKKYGGLFVEVDKKLSRSTRAKIEAFLQFNVFGGMGR